MCAQRASLMLYPIRHPVMLKVFEYPEMVMVRLAIPGTEPGLICRLPS